MRGGGGLSRTHGFRGAGRGSGGFGFGWCGGGDGDGLSVTRRVWRLVGGSEGLVCVVVFVAVFESLGSEIGVLVLDIWEGVGGVCRVFGLGRRKKRVN